MGNIFFFFFLLCPSIMTLPPSQTITNTPSSQGTALCMPSSASAKHGEFGRGKEQPRRGEGDVYWAEEAVGWETTEEQTGFHLRAAHRWAQRQAARCKKRWLRQEKENKRHWVAQRNCVYRKRLDHYTNMFWAVISSCKGRWAAPVKQ